MKDDLEKPPLEYEQRASFVSTKQYRRLMALTLLNTILLASFIIAPAAKPLFKSQWDQYQQKRAARQAAELKAAAVAQARTFTLPADLVIYEEDPDRAAKLLADDPQRYAVIRNVKATYFPPKPWQAPVFFNHRPPGANYVGAERPVVFMHALQKPRGLGECMVGVGIPDISQAMNITIDGNEQRRSYRIETNRTLTARTSDGITSTLKLDRGVPRSGAIWTKGETDFEHGSVEFEKRGLFRIYAGQHDPADATHFTIDYELDGVRGTIDGYLRENGRVEFVPRTGAIVDRDPQGRNYVWDPYAAPTTRP